MKYLLLLIVIAWTLSCAITACNKEQSPCDRVSGTWETTFGPKSVYTFQDGICTIISPIDTTTRHYACDGQEMKLNGLDVELTSDSTLLIRTGGLVNINLKRI